MKSTSMSIYQILKQAKVPLDSHESDLYAQCSDKSKELLKNYEFLDSVKVFRSQVDKKLWYEIPFAYDPFWEKKGCNAKKCGGAANDLVYCILSKKG